MSHQPTHTRDASQTSVDHPTSPVPIRAERRGTRVTLAHGGQRWWFELDADARATLEDATTDARPAWLEVVLVELGAREVCV